MQQYGRSLPFNNKKSGWWTDRHDSPRPLNADRSRQRRWKKRIARRVGKKIIHECITEIQSKNTHY